MNKEEKKATLEKLRNAEAVYVIMSNCTRLPYVMCDPDTYDDEILLYYTEEEAKKTADSFLKEKKPVQVAEVEKAKFLPFYNSLFPMGVNCIKIGKGTQEETAVQLTELIVRPSADMLPEGKVRIENPEFHLTAIYFMQEYRRRENPEVTEEMKELQEEMMTHYKEGRFIVAYQEADQEKGMMMLKQKDGQVFQPLFTDFLEFQKFQSFNAAGKLKTAAIEAERIPEILTQEAVGVTVNPFGVNLQLKIERKKAEKESY